MSISDRFVASPRENCQSKRHLPKAKTRTCFAVQQGETPEQARSATLWALAGMLVASYVGASGFIVNAAIAPLYAYWYIALLAGLVIVARIIAKCILHGWDRFTFITFIVLPLCGGLGVSWYSAWHGGPVEMLGLGALIWEGVLFRRLYHTRAGLGMFDVDTLRRWNRWNLLPKGLRRKGRVAGFWDALKTHFRYNSGHTPRWVPGVWVPLFGINWRFARTIFTITLAGGAATKLCGALISGVALVVAVDTAIVGALLMLLVGTVPLLMWLGVMLLSVCTMAGKAYALKSVAMSPHHWRRLIERIQSSDNPVEKNSLFLGVTEDCRAPILYDFAQAFRHAWLVGSTRQGKTSFLCGLVDQVMYRGDTSVIFLDLKSFSSDVLASMQQSAYAASVKNRRDVNVKHWTLTNGRSTYLFDIFSTVWWNNLPPTIRTGVALSSLNLAYSAAYGKSYFRDACFELLEFVLQRHPNVRSWAELAHYCREASRAGSGLDDEVRREGKHVFWVIKRLGSFSAINGHPGVSSDVQQNSLDFSTAFHTPEHYYFDLSAIKNSFLGGEIGRFIGAAALAAGAAIPVSQRKTRVLLVIDEFHEMCAEDTAVLFSQASGLGMGCWITSHSAGQLVTSDYDLVPIVEGNTALQVFLSAADRQSREQIAGLGGEMIDLATSRSVNSRGEENVTYSQQIVDRVSGPLLSAIESDPTRMLIRTTQNGGLWCPDGLMVAGRWMFHQTARQYKANEQMPWPPATSETLVNGPLPPIRAPRGPRRQVQTVGPLPATGGPVRRSRQAGRGVPTP